MSRDFIPADFVSSRELVEALRRELAGHNQRVILAAFFTLGAAVVLWAALYAAAYWLTLLFLSSVRGLDASVPAEFRLVFWSAAAALLAFAALDRQLHPDDRPRDHRSTGEIVLDLILAVPRITLSLWSTLSAWLRLSGLELAQAAVFLERLAHERRILLQNVPLEIPNDRARERILLALQLVQAIDLRRVDRDHWVTLGALRPKALFGGGPAAPRGADAEQE